jgi:hypothetical protein
MSDYMMGFLTGWSGALIGSIIVILLIKGSIL